MSLIHADAIDVLLADPGLSVAGVFTPRLTSIPVNCRAIISRRDPSIHIGATGALNPAWRIMLKQADVPVRPRRDDIVAILEDRWIGTYVVHTIREDSFAPSWDLDVGGQARFPPIPGEGPSGGVILLRPRVGIPLTVLDATHVQFPDIPNAAGVLIFANALPLRPVPSAPGTNEFTWLPGAMTATIGAGTLSPPGDAVWALYFSP